MKKRADTETKLLSHLYTIRPGQEWTAVVLEKPVMILFPGMTCE